MKALCWSGKNKVQVDNVPDPSIQETEDIIVKVTATAICGSDLHLYNATVPTMKEGDVLGHEFMGEVVETGSEVKKFKKGDRVVAPFTVSCGHCYFCEQDLFSLCDNSNPNGEVTRQYLGQPISGMYGYSHLMGGFSGGQAEYVRVPYAETGPIKVPDSLPDDKVLFLSDIFPTGYMAAENAQISEGDTVAVWGCGPVGQFTIQSAWMMGAGRVIAIDSVAERLDMAEQHGNAETIRTTDSSEVYETMMEMTNGNGPDSCVDAVGAEAHGSNILSSIKDQTMEALYLQNSKPYVLQQMIYCCRKAGTISIPGAYAGFVNGIPLGAAMNKALTFKMGQTHVQQYMKPLLGKIEDGSIDPSFVITHRLNLEDGPEAYKTFRDKKEGCIKVVMSPD